MPQLRASAALTDRKSTRLNSSHRCISYAVFCLKKLTRIYDVTGVAPLAMLLISGQIYYQAVNRILRVIEEAGITKLSDEVYRFIFRFFLSDRDTQNLKLFPAPRLFRG